MRGYAGLCIAWRIRPKAFSCVQLCFDCGAAVKGDATFAATVRDPDTTHTYFLISFLVECELHFAIGALAELLDDLKARK